MIELWYSIGIMLQDKDEIPIYIDLLGLNLTKRKAQKLRETALLCPGITRLLKLQNTLDSPSLLESTSK